MLPEFVDFINGGYLQKEDDYEDADLPKSYKDLLDIWRGLGIGNYFHEYQLRGDVFKCHIEKKVNRHSGLLRDDYEKFLTDIIVPITSEITRCKISSDDVDCFEYEYSDFELRGIPFRLQDKVKRVEHIYREDGSEIIESRVVYKLPIKKAQVLDLNRAYGIS